MKLVIKGDFDVLSQYNIIQSLYIILPQALKQLDSADEVDDKQELTFSNNLPYLSNYKLKLIRNKKTQTITAILK